VQKLLQTAISPTLMNVEIEELLRLVERAERKPPQSVKREKVEMGKAARV
jgi:hypothetical protein